MKTLSKKQRHNIYKKALNKLVFSDYENLEWIFLCWELARVIRKDLNNRRTRDKLIEPLKEFWLFKPDDNYSVWFSANETYGLPVCEARLFVLQMLVEMTK